MQHVDQTLQLLQYHQLFLTQSKCVFEASKIEDLCHILKDKVYVNPRKVLNMKNCPCPNTLNILHGFFKIMGIYIWVRNIKSLN